MKQIIALALGLATLLTWTGCSKSRDPKSSAPHDIRPVAERFVHALSQEDFAGAVGHFDATMKNALPEAKLREAWNSIAQQAGPFKQTLGTRTMQQAGFDIVFVTCEFERAIVDAKVVFDSTGQISGLWFVPGRRPTADSAQPASPPTTIREREVTVGHGQWALPGTLSLPATGAGPWPAVVLVHGSGPNDRDETVGFCKPFRDLAWGLADQGIAVLRYEKATKAHPEKFLSLSGMTVKEETIDDAVRAVELLRATEGIATNRIFVLGHSLGGTVAPRIGKADPEIAGLIILAGSTRPLEDAMMRQTRYILSLDGGLSADDEAKLAKLQAQVDKVKHFSASDASSDKFVLGAPPSYWLDLRNYDAPAVAATLNQPILILQGGRDYQVTQQDFEGWKRALSNRPNVTFKLYPGLNHLFIAGKGKSTPAEYEQPGRVAKEVINDIAAWIGKQ